MEQKFSAQIYKLGINPCVDLPPRLSKAFIKLSGQRGYVPVVGALNGHALRATLVPKGSGQHRLFLNGELRKRAGVDVGDTVEINLTIDTESRDLPVPAELEEALRGVDLWEAFKRLTPSDRRYILVWLQDAKQEATRARRIETLVRRLRDRAFR